MFFWRLLSITLLIIGLFLFLQSLLLQNINFFYSALALYGFASVIWLTIKKLYINFSMPKNPKSNTSYSNWILYDDIFSFIELLLSLPKILFLFLIHTIYD